MTPRVLLSLQSSPCDDDRLTPLFCLCPEDAYSLWRLL
jgi:hypothetical protein